MRRSSFFLIVFVSAVVPISLARSAGIDDSNLLANAAFDDGLLGWNVNDPANVAWVVDYSFPPPDSDGVGAAAVFKEGVLSQCVDVTEGATYRTSTWIRSKCSNSVPIEIEWNSGGGCSGSAIDQSVVVLQVGSDTWQLLKDDVVAPAFAESAIFRLLNEGSCTEVEFFEEAFFGDQIFANTFE